MLFELTPLETVFEQGKYAGGIDPFSVHRTGAYLVLHTDKGAGHHTVDLERYTLHPGAFLFIGPRQIMQFDTRRSYGGHLLRFSADFLHPLGKSEEIIALTRLFNNGTTTSSLDGRRHREIITFFDLIQKELLHSRDAFSNAIVRSALDLMLLHAARLVSQKSTVIDPSEAGFVHYRRFRALLDQQVDASRNAVDFASQLGISYKYLNDLCKLHAGTTAKELIDDGRIAEAKRLLVRDRMSVRDTAQCLGFDDPSNFRKYFRKLTGVTPGAFRESHSTIG
jgi:AraC-like DNA-binding protein